MCPTTDKFVLKLLDVLISLGPEVDEEIDMPIFYGNFSFWRIHITVTFENGNLKTMVPLQACVAVLKQGGNR